MTPEEIEAIIIDQSKWPTDVIAQYQWVKRIYGAAVMSVTWSESEQKIIWDIQGLKESMN